MLTEPQRAVRFSLGRILITPGAFAALERNAVTAIPYLARHLNGDWGELGEEDSKQNEEALQHGARLLSAYSLSDDTRIWIITEAANGKGARQATTVLLPEEY